MLSPPFRFAALVLGPILAGCSLGPADINTDRLSPAERHAAGQVELFPASGSIPVGTERIGPIEARSCRYLFNDQDASRDDALLKLRVAAVRAGANAVADVTVDATGPSDLGTTCWGSMTAAGVAARIVRR